MESGAPPPPGAEPPAGAGPPSEEELRAQLEEEMSRVRVQDLLLQSVAGLVNLTARRIAKEDEQDLDQARIGIDAVSALVDLLDPEPQAQVRQALSELQMIYARASGGGSAPDGSDEGGSGGESKPPPEPPRPPAGGAGGKPPPRLWTPGR